MINLEGPFFFKADFKSSYYLCSDQKRPAASVL